MTKIRTQTAVRGDHRAHSERNCFVGSLLDRSHGRRQDDAWIAERLVDPTTRLTFLWRSKHLVTPGVAPRPVLRSPLDIEPPLKSAEPPLFLGLAGTEAWFALELPADAPPPEELGSLGDFRDLRELALLLPPGESGVFAHARGLAHWHRRHRFCGDCGSPTVVRHAGHVRVCSLATCASEHFPRTDPAVIVLVARGDRCLLGTQPAWPKGRYSAIAGFVEPGESLEEAVAREVEEETGIVVGPIRYHSSQPWPFPASLMLGFAAEALTDEIRLDDELEDARWFTRAELRNGLADGTLRIPQPLSIAYRLIESWYDGSGRRPLVELARQAW
jgi:NAD+ diphosphatase